MELQVTQKMSHGLRVKASLTWRKTIDPPPGSRTEDQFNNSFPALPFFDNRLNRGLADFNVGKNLVINFTWQLPAPKFSSSLASSIGAGCRFGGVVEASSCAPFFINLGGDPLGHNRSDPFDVPNRLGGAGCSSL